MSTYLGFRHTFNIFKNVIHNKRQYLIVLNMGIRKRNNKNDEEEFIHSAQFRFFYLAY